MVVNIILVSLALIVGVMAWQLCRVVGQADQETDEEFTMEREVYVIGSKPAPNWCKDKLTPYLKMNGSVGFEYQGVLKTYDLKAGDRLIKQGRRVEIHRKKG